jgi:hypothetical protein
MAILKVGDWVLTDRGEVGQVTIPDWGATADKKYGYSLVQFKGQVVASVRMTKTLTFIDPAFHKLLTDVNKESNDD